MRNQNHHILSDIKLLNTIPLPAVLFDSKKFCFINKQARQLLKIPLKTQISELSLFDFFFLKKAWVNKLLLEKEPKTIETKIKTTKGQTTKALLTASAVIYNKKQSVLAIFNVGNTSKQNDVESGSAKRLLLETKTKFDLITNNGNDIIAFHTFYPKEKYLYVSPNIEKILGFKPKELLENNRFISERISKNRDEFVKMDKLLKQYQRKNLQKNDSFHFRILKKNKEEIWLENSFMPIKNEKGKIEFFLYIFRNITIQKEKEIEVQSQYTNYKNLLDSSPAAYVIHENGVCVYANNALVDLFKIKNKKEVLGRFILDFIQPHDRKKALDRIKKTYKNKRIDKRILSYDIIDFEGNQIQAEIRSILIKFNDRDCILSMVTNLSEQRRLEKEKQKALITETDNKLLQREIQERQEAEKKLIGKTAQLSAILESSTHLIWTINKSFKLTSFNKNFQDVVKLNYGVVVNNGDKIDELILEERREDYINFWYPKYEQAFKGIKQEFEKEEFVYKRVHRKIFMNPVFNLNNEITEISCIAHDITDSKIYEQKLLSQSGKLTAIFDSSHHYIWTINKEEKLTSFNKNYYDLVTSLYNTKPYVGLVLDRGVLSNDRQYTMMLKLNYAKAFNGQATSFEIETYDKEQKRVYLEIFFNPIYENGNVVEVSGIAHNVTEKKQVQQRMELSLKEKEILLREVHHRVKNNMQVISSILNLQSSYVSDEYALTLLKESQNRIKTMAYIHESLYQNKSFTSVNFSDYVQTLVNNIIQSYTYSNEKVKLELNIEKITLSLDGSIPAGLIINELMTNSIKHAFPGTRQGTIYFNLRTENNFVFLELKDDGIGFAEGVDFENSHSLGLQLVNTLIEQIEGKLTFKSEKNKGTEIAVTFKM